MVYAVESLCDDLKAHPERTLMLIPVGTQHFEAPYLRRRAHMLADAGADIVIADAHQSDSVAGITRQTVELHVERNLIARDKLEGHGQVFVNQLVHPPFNLTLLLTAGLMVQVEAHLALLSLHMGIITALTSEDTNHRLVEQMLGRVGRGKLLLVVFIEYIIIHNGGKSTNNQRYDKT